MTRKFNKLDMGSCQSCGQKVSWRAAKQGISVSEDESIQSALVVWFETGAVQETSGGRELKVQRSPFFYPHLPKFSRGGSRSRLGILAVWNRLRLASPLNALAGLPLDKATNPP